MTPMPLEPGRVALSTAGRDKGRYFMILERVDDQYVFMADGVLRRIDKPKKKKCKHLQPKPVLITSLRDKLSAGMRIFDAEVRKALAEQGFIPDQAR